MVLVKLPKEVLNLFPAWEYRCPCCGTYVESNISFCPNCKTPFDENEYRVPPRFLRSHDAMSEYAHKVLAPKLTQKQRELLFQYFTELFSDGFESGSFDAWDGTDYTSGETVSVVSTDPHHGTYHGKFSCDASSDGEHAYCYKNLSDQTDLAVRAYVKIKNSLPTTNKGFSLIGVYNIDGDGWIATVQVQNVAGTVKWGLAYFDGWSSQSSTASTGPSLDTWYCVELYLSPYSDNGTTTVYVDGEEGISEDSDNNNRGAIDHVRVGEIYSTDYINPHEIYIDCVVVADTYVGPESIGQTYTKTWTTDSLFKKLGITKPFNVDTAFQKQDIPKSFGLNVAFEKSFIIQKQIDSLLKKFNIPKNFVLNAHFGSLMTNLLSKQIDVLLKKLDATKTFGLDTYFGAVAAETYARSLGLNVIFAYRVRLPELWLDENGKLVLNISKPYAWVGT